MVVTATGNVAMLWRDAFARGWPNMAKRSREVDIRPWLDRNYYGNGRGSHTFFFSLPRAFRHGNEPRVLTILVGLNGIGLMRRGKKKKRKK